MGYHPMRLLAIALLLMLPAAMAAYTAIGTTQATTGSTGTDNSAAPMGMGISVSENCSGIFVSVASTDYGSKGAPIPGAKVEADALPRTNIVVLASGETGADGVFAFNTSAVNVSISAVKDGYSAARAVFEPKHPFCPPKLLLVTGGGCGEGWIEVMADSAPAAGAVVSSGGAALGTTDGSGNLSMTLAEPANITIAYKGASLETIYVPPDCSAAGRPPSDANASVPAGPNASNGTSPPAAYPSPPPVSASDPMLIAGVVIIVLAVSFILWKSLGRDGTGPTEPKGIGPGPMKGKSAIGPGPMKDEIGPGPMKDEIGPGPM
jgi:hypothetical protein